MADNPKLTIDEARILPRLRPSSGILEQHRMRREQATVLIENVAEYKPKNALTKPGDPRQLRGIPAIGRSVTGAIPGTDPRTITNREAA